jgi:hypothetical protein
VTGYNELIDPDASAEGALVLDLPAGTTPLALAGALDELFSRVPAAERVVVIVGGVRLGVATRVVQEPGTRGAPPIAVDECPECLQATRHEPWCSAAAPHPPDTHRNGPSSQNDPESTVQ